mgnify:FL=1
MKHIHKYKTEAHLGINPRLIEMGVQSAEIRKCRTCHKEMTFVQIREGDWLPLLDDRETDEQDILLA